MYNILYIYIYSICIDIYVCIYICIYIYIYIYIYTYGSFSFVAVHSYPRPVKAHKFCIFGLWLVVGGLVVGGWWLVVVVGGGDDLGSGIRYLRPPTIRMRVK